MSLERLKQARLEIEDLEHSRLESGDIEAFDKEIILIHRVCHDVMNDSNRPESPTPWTQVPIWKDVRPD